MTSTDTPRPDLTVTPTGASLFCPAKINLFLEVHDRRPDGYHDLGTLFQALAIGDTLHGSLSDTLTLTGAEGITPDPETNLVLRAARLLLAEVNRGSSPLPLPAPGIHFRLEKRLPAGAGLGGGSSDAAGALILANHLWKLNVSPTRLAEMARELGADVPFFLFGGTAFAEGIGEKLLSAPEPFPFHIVIATPKASVETAWAYRNLDPERKRNWSKFKAMFHIHCEDPGFYRLLHNDFEAPMLRHFEPIATLHQKLQALKPVKVMLSGSGASLFALFTERAAAESALLDIAPWTRYQALTHFLD